MEINYLLSLIYENGLHKVDHFLLCKQRTYVLDGRPINFQNIMNIKYGLTK